MPIKRKCRESRDDGGEHPQRRQKLEADSFRPGPGPKTVLIEMPIEILYRIWDLAGEESQEQADERLAAQRDAVQAARKHRQVVPVKPAPSPRVEIYKTMNLVCKHFHQTVQVTKVIHGHLRLFTNHPGAGQERMMYLNDKGEHLTSKAEHVVIVSKWHWKVLNGDNKMSWEAEVHPQYMSPNSLIADLLDKMSALRELRLLDFVYPKGLRYALSVKKLRLLTVRTLVMHLGGYCSDIHALIIEACPNVVSLGWNADGPYAGRRDYMIHLVPHDVWRAAQKLTKLEELRCFVFGIQERMYAGVSSDKDGQTFGWFLKDVDAIHKHLPNLRRLSLFGNLHFAKRQYGSSSPPATSLHPESFIPGIAQFQQLEHLVLTDEMMPDMKDLEAGFNDPVQRLDVAAQFFESCSPRLQRVSFVCKEDGATYQSKRTMNGATAEFLENFSNTHYCVYQDERFLRLGWL